jgi:flagellar basal body P-ring protein FlgI
MEKAKAMEQKMTALKIVSKFILLLIFFLSNAQADRLKDLTSIAGVRSNQLVGYGLVVGLPGTGDGNSPLTLQSMQAMISQFGVTTNSALICRIAPPVRDPSRSGRC